jgi:hypothetical protein
MSQTFGFDPDLLRSITASWSQWSRQLSELQALQRRWAQPTAIHQLAVDYQALNRTLEPILAHQATWVAQMTALVAAASAWKSAPLVVPLSTVRVNVAVVGFDPARVVDVAIVDPQSDEAETILRSVVGRLSRSEDQFAKLGIRDQAGACRALAFALFAYAAGAFLAANPTLGAGLATTATALWLLAAHLDQMD